MFVACFMGIASLGAATYFSCVFLFRGILSLAPTGLPRFRRVLDSFAAILINCPSETSIRAGLLAVGI